MKNKKGVTLLMNVCLNPHLGASKIFNLLKDTYLVSIHEVDNDGNTCVHHAVYAHNLEILQLLHKSGADFKSYNRKGQSPLQFCLGIHDTVTMKIREFLLSLYNSPSNESQRNVKHQELSIASLEYEQKLVKEIFSLVKQFPSCSNPQSSKLIELHKTLIAQKQGMYYIYPI
jgi:hypothetical protein